MFNLSLPYRVGKTDRRAFARDASISAFLFRTAARTKQERMSQSDRCIWGRLQDKLLVRAIELSVLPAPLVGRCSNCRAELSEPITDADNSVFFDLDAKRQDKADAKRCYVVKSMSRGAYEEEYDDNPASWPKTIHKTEFDWSTPDLVFVDIRWTSVILYSTNF